MDLWIMKPHGAPIGRVCDPSFLAPKPFPDLLALEFPVITTSELLECPPGFSLASPCSVSQS